METEKNLFPYTNFKFTGIVIGLYLAVVLKLGRLFMKNRKPFDLKKFMVAYNICQIVSCILVVKGILEDPQVPPMEYFSRCQPPDFFTKPTSLYKFSVGVYLLKASEMIETIVFILRKKWQQVTVLHVFHHCATLTLAYLAGWSGQMREAFFSVGINSTVHIIMYSYYLAAALCSQKTVEKLLPIKQNITVMQMLQFVMILVQSAIHRLYYKCDCHSVTYYFLVSAVAIIFYFFYDFYKKSYNRAVGLKN